MKDPSSTLLEMPHNLLRQTIQRNCDISDASGSRAYSLCTLFLRLRGFFKWEQGMEPWQEPESGELLDWIAAKEAYWQTLEGSALLYLAVDGNQVEPFLTAPINSSLSGHRLYYGAGYGRGLKPIFFFAEKLADTLVEGCRTIILGHELARELAAPFAMLQDEVIFIRKEPLRYFLWDQITDIRPSGKCALKYALNAYGLLDLNGLPDRGRLREMLDSLTDHEMTSFIYHEVGELKESTFDRGMVQRLLAAFAGSPLELAVRAVKDMLADTHPLGMLSHILDEQKKGSLGFYLTFLDGLRRTLGMKISEAFPDFLKSGDWQRLRIARDQCRKENLVLAQKLADLGRRLDEVPLEQIREAAEQEILIPLGIKSSPAPGLKHP